MCPRLIEAVGSHFLNIAHRGARSLAPENTLSAAGKAMALGAHMWEIDVRLSRDGHPVVIHDETLARTSNASDIFPDRRPWRVEDFTLDELKSLDCGSWFLENDPFGLIGTGDIPAAQAALYRREPMPTLEEALLFTIEKDWLVNIEIKDLSGQAGQDAAVAVVGGMISRMGATDRVLVSSFNHEYLLQIKGRDERIPTGALVASPHADPVKLLKLLGAVSYHPALRAVRPWDLRRLKAKGCFVLVYTVNNMNVAQALRMAGAAGIFTDYPQRFQEFY